MTGGRYLPPEALKTKPERRGGLEPELDGIWEWCPRCSEWFIAYGHYHCVTCGDVVGMMGHSCPARRIAR